MALTKYKLVGDTKAVFFKGDTIRVEDIDDALADKLYGKTHVLERLTPEPTSAVAAPAQLAPASEPAAAEGEAPAAGRRRASN
ncbi:hypothetical protein [Hymenobacter cheonanensis]|uniref:hypothetical protein n=1 Tax=Hymenobacter sp. CA2-7 TaxID=3063993 RepID=UPI002713FDE9|nr:hypothetical protein [Hymenobacter sp. CA2-7]MDO7885349.1 hypothetical protein [Hymenobacter sp. CA2-7]